MKVVVLICGSLSLPNEVEEIIHRTIYDTIKKRDKGFIVWLKNGRLTVDTDVLAQLLNPALILSCTMSPGGAAQGKTNDPLNSFEQNPLELPTETKSGYECGNENLQQQRVFLPAATQTCQTNHDSVTGKLILKSKLRFGNVSFESADLEFLCQEFREIPDDMIQHLLKTYQHVDERRVKIMFVPSHKEQVVWVGDQEIEMADNDLLLLKTRVKNGEVSFHKDDVESRYPADWKVPRFMAENMRKNRSNGKLFIISDEKGNLRSLVKSAMKDRLAEKKDKVLAFFTSKKESPSETKYV